MTRYKIQDTGCRIEDNHTSYIGHHANEKGIALVMVLLLSVIALAIMAGLIYMLTVGTQISGMQKRYKTALEAGVGGADISYELIAARGNPLDPAIVAALTLDTTTPTICKKNPACTDFTDYTGIAAKLNLPTSCWSDCDSSLNIIPGISSTYDMTFVLGTAPQQYRVFSKIVDTIAGNSGGDEGLIKGGVVSAGAGEVAVVSRPYLYTIEIDAQNAANPAERAKLSVLYQY